MNSEAQHRESIISAKSMTQLVQKLQLLGMYVQEDRADFVRIVASTDCREFDAEHRPMVPRSCLGREWREI